MDLILEMPAWLVGKEQFGGVTYLVEKGSHAQ